MYNNRYVTEISISEVKDYYETLREKRKLTHEEIEDLGICKERLIEYSFDDLAHQDNEIIRLLKEINSKIDKFEKWRASDNGFKEAAKNE